MSDEISFEQILSLVRREQTRQDLQEIDSDLYKDALSLLKAKEKKIKSQESQQSLISTNVELEKEKRLVLHIRKQLNDLIDLRQKKIINFARMRARLPNTIINNELLTSEEKNFFEKTVKSFREFKSSLLNDELIQEDIEPISEKIEVKQSIEPIKQSEIQSSVEMKSEEPKISQEAEPKEKQPELPVEATTTTSKVKFLVDMPKFYGTSKDILGPFKQGEVAKVPNLIANALVRKGRAELQNE